MSLWRMILTAVNLVGLRLGGALMGLVCQILLARLMPQHDVGVILMGLSAASIISLLMTAGYPSLTMTVLTRYYALGRRSLVEQFQRAVWRDGAIATAAVAVIILAVWLWAPIGTDLGAALLFGSLMAPAAALIRITGSTANAQRRFHLSYVPDFLFRPGLLMVFLVVAMAMNAAPDRMTVIVVIIAITTLVAGGQAWVLGRGALPSSLRIGRHDLRPMLRGRAAAMVLIAAVAMNFADIVTLIGGLFLDSQGVAQLGIAIRLAALAGFVTQVTQNFVLPDLSAAIVAGDRPGAGALIRRINLISVAAIAACTAIAMAFGPLILWVFGSPYGGAYWPLVLLMASQLFRAAGGMNQHLLSLRGYQQSSVVACVFAMAVLYAAASALTPAFGLLGMAVAVMAAEASWAAVLGIQAHVHTGLRGDVFARLAAPAAPAE